MRHKVYISKRPWAKESIVNGMPYETEYVRQYQKDKFKSATPNKTYMKVLKYVADHPGCKRREIIVDAIFERANDPQREKALAACSYYGRGQHSNMFSQLLYLDLIDYDKKYCYTITKKGLELVERVFGYKTNNEKPENQNEKDTMIKKSDEPFTLDVFANANYVCDKTDQSEESLENVNEPEQNRFHEHSKLFFHYEDILESIINYGKASYNHGKTETSETALLQGLAMQKVLDSLALLN